MFAAHVREMESIGAERILDAAQAAAAVHAGREWWDKMLARARGVAVEAVRRVVPLFTWNGRGINSSAGLRKAFSEGVTGGRVES
jgi:hypothetical protein